MSWLHALRERIVALTMGATRDHDLTQEIAHHLALETQRQIEAGYAPDEARRRALARFGDPMQIADATREARGAQLMEGGMQDLRWSIRSLRKSAGFTALALCTLALGIGATTTAFTVLDTVLLRPLPYRDAERLVFMQERTANQSLLPPSFPNFVDWRDRARAFDGVASAMFPFSGTVWPSPSAEPLRATIMGVSQRFFAILGAPLVIGREFTETENALGGPRVAMVSYEFWQSQMGGRQPLGTINYGGAPRPVVGVLPPNFRFVSAADVYVPHEQFPGTIRSAHNYMVVGRLRPGVSIDAARTDMTALSRSLHQTFGDETQAVDADVVPLRDYVVGNFRLLLSVVFGAAAMVLLIACVNLLSAQLARGWMREHEVIVRAALGASRGRLVRQLCFETGVLVVTGASLGVGIAFALTSAIKRFGVGLVPRLTELSIDARVLGFVVALTLLTAVAVGIYPALRSSRGRADLALRGTRGSGATVRASMWRALVGFEVALAVVLLVGSTLLIRTLRNILNAETGIDTRGVVTAAFTPDSADLARIDQLRAQLASVPGIAGVAFTNRLPFTWGNTAGPVRRPGDSRTSDWPAMAGYRVITPEYFTVMRQSVLSGRAFAASDRLGAPGVAIITRGIAEKLWPGQEPIGKTIATNYLMDEWLTVVGVVDEAASWSMPRGSQNEIFVPLAQHNTRLEGQLIAVMRTPNNPSTAMPALRAKLREFAPRLPAQLSTIEERIARTAADKRFAMLALTAFGVIALVLAGIGIYGVVWYVVTTRTREIGIRMALGATAQNVKRRVLGGALAMAGAGIAAGVIGSVFATKYLQASLYGVSRLDPMTYGIGAAVALVVALAGAYVPAWRSSRVDPMIAIRAEG